MTSIRKLIKTSSTRRGSDIKYYIECENRITKETPNTSGWLEIEKTLNPTNRRELSHILKGIFERRRKVVAKVSDRGTLKKEYDLGLKLYRTSPGFIKYICYFSCNDDYRKYKEVDKVSSLCYGKGDTMNVLVLPYYELGSVRDYDWTGKTHILIQCMKQIILSYFQSFLATGFYHNDIHLANVLIKPTTKEFIEYSIDGVEYKEPTYNMSIVIIDFENSIIIEDKTNVNYVYMSIFQLMTDFMISMRFKHLYTSSIINVVDLAKKYSQNRVPAKKGIPNLFRLLDLIDFNEESKSGLTRTYDPNVF